jgi:hypothetical protein
MKQLQNELWIDLNKFNTMEEKMELLESVMTQLELDFSIDYHFIENKQHVITINQN